MTKLFNKTQQLVNKINNFKVKGLPLDVILLFIALQAVFPNEY